MSFDEERLDVVRVKGRAHFEFVAPPPGLVRHLGLDPEGARFPWSCPRDYMVTYRGQTRAAMDVPPGDTAMVTFSWPEGHETRPCGECKPCRDWQRHASAYLRDNGRAYPVPARCADPVIVRERTVTGTLQLKRLRSDNQLELALRMGPQDFLLSNHPDAMTEPVTLDAKERDAVRFQRVQSALVPTPPAWGVNLIQRGDTLALTWGAEVLPALAKTLEATVRRMDPEEAYDFLAAWSPRKGDRGPLTVVAFIVDTDQTATDEDPESYRRMAEVRRREMAALADAAVRADAAAARAVRDAYFADCTTRMMRATIMHRRERAANAARAASVWTPDGAAYLAPRSWDFGPGTPEPRRTRYNPPGAPYPRNGGVSRDGNVIVAIEQEFDDRVQITVVVGPGVGRTLWMPRAAYAARFGA